MAKPACGRRKGAKARRPALLRLAGEPQPGSVLPSLPHAHRWDRRTGRAANPRYAGEEGASSATPRQLGSRRRPASPGLQRAAQPRRPETPGSGGNHQPDQGSRRRGQKRLPGRVSQELSGCSSGERQSEEGRPSSAPRPPLPFPRPGNARVGGGGCTTELAPLEGKAGRGTPGRAPIPRGCDEGKSCGGERQADGQPRGPGG